MIKNLQKSLNVTADGIAGINTWTAFFRKAGAQPATASELAICSTVFFPQYEILTPLRLRHFMAQLLHESGSFRYMEEIASGAAYEGRKDLGNVNAGDGKRYKGRGPIQLTGRANYRKYGRRIGIDLESHPHIAAIPSIGLRLALEYWDQNKLNTFADKDDITTITKRINGGLNGFQDRKNHLQKLKAWIA